jgi:hypothetical protein
VDASIAAVAKCRTTYEALESLQQRGLLENLAGRVTYRRENARRETRAKGRRNCMADQFARLVDDCPVNDRVTVYAAEIRRRSPECRPDASRQWRKSTLATTMRERVETLGVDTRDFLYWDDYSEGTFLGGSGAGARTALCG